MFTKFSSLILLFILSTYLISAQTDEIPPILNEFSFTPENVNVTYQNKSINFTTIATDVYPGIDTIIVTLESPTSSTLITGHAGVSELVAGNITNGTYNFEVIIPQASETGTWDIKSVQIIDLYDNISVYTTSELVILGFKSTIDITKDSDISPPVLTDFDWEIVPEEHIVDPNIQITFEATDDISGIDSFVIVVEGPATFGIQQIIGSQNDLIAGDSIEGTYEIIAKTEKFRANGIYCISEITIYDADGNFSTYPRSDCFEIEALFDNDIPQITGFSFTPISIDVTTQNQEITFTLLATDDVSGVDTILLQLESPSGNEYIHEIISLNQLIVGDSTNGTFLFTLTIPETSESGDWTIQSIELTDKIQNVTEYSYSDIANMGFNNTIQVINEFPDTKPPSLENLSILPDSVDITTKNQKIGLYLSCNDNFSGINQIKMWIEDPNGTKEYYPNWYLVNGTNTNGTYKYELNIPAYSDTGVWRIIDLILVDNENNRDTLNTEELINMNFNTEIIVTGSPDLEPPIIKNFSFNPVTFIELSRLKTFTIEITDSLSGLNSGYIVLRDPSNIQYHAFIHVPTSLISGDKFFGIYESNFSFPEYVEEGNWRIEKIYLYDNHPNVTNYSENQLNNLGFNTRFTVNKCIERKVNENIFICEGEDYEGWTQTGTYQRILELDNGCDSIVTTNLTVFPEYIIHENIEICEGENYFGWTQAGTFQRNLKSKNGCDSIIETHLIVFPDYNTQEDIQICEGESFNNWTQTGTYQRILNSVNGCDSIITTNLTVFPVLEIQEDRQICEGENYFGWTEIGNYQRTLKSKNGCDSIVNTNLTVTPILYLEENIQICEGQEYFGWTESGNYQRIMNSTNGCDSIISTNLIVNALPKTPVITIKGDTLSVTNEYELYQWYRDNEILINETNRNCIINKSGNFTVEVSDLSNCSSESYPVSVIFSSYSELKNNFNINILPNPNDGNFFLKIENINEPVEKIDIYNILGEKVVTKNISRTSITINEQFNLSNINPGEYFLRIITKTKSLSKTIIIVK